MYFYAPPKGVKFYSEWLKLDIFTLGSLYPQGYSPLEEDKGEMRGEEEAAPPSFTCSLLCCGEVTSELLQVNCISLSPHVNGDRYVSVCVCLASANF